MKNAKLKHEDNIKYPLRSKTARERYQACTIAVGATKYDLRKPNAFTPAVDWYKSWLPIVECMRGGKDAPTEYANFGSKLSRYLGDTCRLRGYQIYGYQKHCFSESCELGAGTCLRTIKHKLMVQPNLLNDFDTSIIDACIEPHESCTKFNSNQPRRFGVYTCKGDCSGHEAGYEWASKKGFTKKHECVDMDSNNSQSFYEGCLVYVESGYEIHDWGDF